MPRPSSAGRTFKIPESVLVIVHTAALDVLLIERADHPGYWQSVTGSLDHAGESIKHAARREVLEETGIDALKHRLADWRIENVYDIYPEWLWRYQPGVTRNTEHVLGLCVPERVTVRLAPREHVDHVWLPWAVAAERCFSPSNAAAILRLPEKIHERG